MEAGAFTGLTPRDRAVLEGMINRGLLTAPGYEWLKIALDPCHDNAPKGFVGMPSGSCGKSVTCRVVSEFQISKPGYLGAGNWNVCISNNPMVETIGVLRGIADANNAMCNTDVINLHTMSGVEIRYSSGSNPFPLYAADTVGLDPEYTKGPYKVCGVGLECINTTAEIYKQGMYTGGTMNQTSQNLYAGTINNVTPTHTWNGYSTVTFSPFRSIPTTLKELLLIANIVNWPAAEGFYSPVRLKDPYCPSIAMAPIAPLLLQNDLASGHLGPGGPGDLTTYIPTNPCLVPLLRQQEAENELGGVWALAEGAGIYHCDSSINMFTGLSDQTSLTLRVVWYIERFPNDQEPSIVVLSRPAPDYDPVALELYNHVVQSMPHAVMFKDNPDWEWWKSVGKMLAGAAAPMLAMVPHPAAKAASLALGGISNLPSSKALKEQPKKKKIQKISPPTPTRGPPPKKKKKKKN